MRRNLRVLKPNESVVLATHNAGKIREMRDFLASTPLVLCTASDFNLAEPDETGETFQENAAIKARAAAIAAGTWALADDSGLCVHALDGWPGVRTADLAGTPRDYTRAMRAVHDALGDRADRTAAFVCVLALNAPDGTCHFFEGRVEGRIVWPPRGDQGFGFEPIFEPVEGDGRTFGEMTLSEKGRFSHRARAFAAFDAGFGTR